MLRFIASGDTLVLVPGAAQVPGQAPKYVNRILQDRAFPAVQEPYQCDEAVSPQRAQRLKKHCRNGDLLPADRATAAACGVPFVEHEFRDGAWTPAKTSKRDAKEHS